ncbi:DegT/DnrJ/EryC1/StrS family aminotransferase [Hymenobacter volaticus]|uniref:DegT/DnrJ/EryC1/StrS family aminotransferase n=1 Tax=Hymenobacter volaticus TaxID=2932254 RepID=UPI0035CC2797
MAQKDNLKLIYDVAHRFGVKRKLQSILNFGQVSTLGFHATKLCYIGEGNAIVTDDVLVLQFHVWLILSTTD